MSAIPNTTRFRIGTTLDWADGTANPNVLPDPGVVGSLYVKQGNGGLTPTETYYRIRSDASGWIRQNTINLDTYNIRDYGAVSGAGCTDAIRAAIDAANAAGGGIVYFPPGNWLVEKRLTAVASFELKNVQNITFLGDGYVSKILMSGNAALSDWYLFYMHDGTSNIKFENLYLDGAAIVNPEPGDQCHLIFNASVSTDTHGPCNNVTVIGCYFGFIVGDLVRHLGSLIGQPNNIRTVDCSMRSPNCRACIGVQRASMECQVVDNFMTGSDDQQIDFEPTGPATQAPHEWNIRGNIVDHGNKTVVCITLNGIGSVSSCLQSVFAYNQLHNGAEVRAQDASRWVIRGNTFIYGANGGSRAGLSLPNGLDSMQIANNILDYTAGGVVEYTPITVSAGTNTRQRNLISGNVMRAFGDNAGGNGINITDDCNDTTIAGNIILVSDATATQANGVRYNAASANIRGAAILGNLVVGINATLQFGITISTSAAFTFGDAIIHGNLIDNANDGLRVAPTGGGSFVQSQVIAGNNCPNSVNTNVSLNANQSITIEGNAKPGSCFLESNGTPGGNVTARVGSIDLNTGGANGTVLWYKESATDTTGWISQGPGDVVFASQDLTVLTTNHFPATGMDQALADTTQIQFAMPRPCNFRAIHVRCGVAGTGGGNVTHTLRRNGSDVGLSVTMANTAVSGSGTGAPAFVAGDLVSIKITKTGVITTSQKYVTISLEMNG